MGIQITKTSTLFPENAKDLEQIKFEFEQNHFIKLPKLLDCELLKLVQSKIREDNFFEDRYKVGDDDAVGFQLNDDSLVGLLHFLMNDPKLFRIIEKITSCETIGCFTGRVYSKIPNQGQYDMWHDDLTDDRMVALSINLSTEIYSGGVLQIRNSISKKIIHEVSNDGFGDGIIFRIAPYLEHRVTKVDGRFKRTVLTGWFRAGQLNKTSNQFELERLAK